MPIDQHCGIAKQAYSTAPANGLNKVQPPHLAGGRTQVLRRGMFAQQRRLQIRFALGYQPIACSSGSCISTAGFVITSVGRRLTVMQNGVKIIGERSITGITGGAHNINDAEPGPCRSAKY